MTISLPREMVDALAAAAAAEDRSKAYLVRKALAAMLGERKEGART